MGGCISRISGGDSESCLRLGKLRVMSVDIPQEALYEGLQVGLRAGQMVGGARYELPYAVLGSFLLWTDFYFILHALNQRCSAEWNCRIVTAIHGTFSASLCLLSALILGPWPFTYLGERNTSLHTTIMVISLGYFLFDFAWCMYMKTEGPVMLAHHIISIVGFLYCLNVGKFGCELTAVMGASEFTNPLLQLRWFLKKTRNYSGRKAFLVDWAFVTFFWGARLVVGSVYHYVCQTSPKLDLFTKAGGQAFYIISWIFGIQLLMFIYRKYIRRRPGKDD